MLAERDKHIKWLVRQVPSIMSAVAHATHARAKVHTSRTSNAAAARISTPPATGPPHGASAVTLPSVGGGRLIISRQAFICKWLYTQNSPSSIWQHGAHGAYGVEYELMKK